MKEFAICEPAPPNTLRWRLSPVTSTCAIDTPGLQVNYIALAESELRTDKRERQQKLKELPLKRTAIASDGKAAVEDLMILSGRFACLGYATRQGIKQEVLVFTDLKSPKELADMVIAEARSNGKCANLTGGTVRGTGDAGDWIFTPAWSGAGVSNDCRLDLIEIEMSIKKRGFGLK